MFSKFINFISQPNIAIDLGTANTRVYNSNLEKVIEEPSTLHLVSHNSTTKNLDKYTEFNNRNIVASPLRGGVIIDIRKAITLLKPLVKKTRRFLIPPISLACAPTDTSDMERHFLTDAITLAGASHVSIIPEVWAAAIGAGIDVTNPYAQVIIDIGDGVTDMAVIRDGRIVYTSAVRTACSDLQKAIRSAIMSKHKIQLYAHDVVQLTHEISSMSNHQEPHRKFVNVRGIDILRRSEVSINVNSDDIVFAMTPVINKILRMIEVGLQKVPESIFCEILESGICLTGGGACIKGIDRLIAFRTKLNVRIAPDPIHSVINGAIQTLNYWKDDKNWWKKISWPKLAS